MRTTNTRVKSIIDTSVTDVELTFYMETAHTMVNSNLAGTSLSSDTLRDIETWLTAHLIASSRDRQTSSERAMDVQVTYAGGTSLGVLGPFLRSTTYGQMVLTLDTTGTLAQLGKQKRSIRNIPSSWQA